VCCSVLKPHMLRYLFWRRFKHLGMSLVTLFCPFWLLAYRDRPHEVIVASSFNVLPKSSLNHPYHTTEDTELNERLRIISKLYNWPRQLGQLWLATGLHEWGSVPVWNIRNSGL
jgi:hypothetical protein